MIDTDSYLAGKRDKKEKRQHTLHQDQAEQAFAELGDKPRWRGQYHAYFAEAAEYGIDLSELVTEAKLKADGPPGPYFLSLCRNRYNIGRNRKKRTT